MRLPRDRVLSSNLRTSFTDYGALLRYLEEERLDGYVALQGDNSIAWLFLAGGVVAGARSGEGTTGRAAVREFEERAREPGYVLNIYRAPGAQMRLLGAGSDAEPLFPPLPSDFVNLPRMMDTLSRAEHSGYVELQLRGGDSVGYVLFERGEPVEAIFSDGAQMETGLGIVPEIVAAVEERGAEISVFRTAADDLQAADPAEEDRPDSAGDESALTEHEATEVATAWSAIFKAVSEVVDGVAEPGAFEEGMREALSEHAETYPFLDAGRGRLTYQHGEVHFVEQPTAGVSRVLGECLNEAVARISFRWRKVDLETRIQQRLEAVGQTHGALFRRHGIEKAAAPFLAA